MFSSVWCFHHLVHATNGLDRVSSIGSVTCLRLLSFILLQSFIVNYVFEKFITLTSRLPYSRRLEQEADEVGLMLAAKVHPVVAKKEDMDSSFILGLLWCARIRELLAKRCCKRRWGKYSWIHLNASSSRETSRSPWRKTTLGFGLAWAMQMLSVATKETCRNARSRKASWRKGKNTIAGPVPKVSDSWYFS